jgi:hypothetical protein
MARHYNLLQTAGGAGGVSRSEGGGEMSRCSDPFSKYLHGSGGAAGVGGENVY